MATAERRRSTVKEIIGDVKAEVTQKAKVLAPGQNIQVSIDNALATPVKIYLAQSYKNPAMQDAKEYTAPAQSLLPIISGSVPEGKATFILRIGVEEAIIIRAAHTAKIRLETNPHGINVSSNDDVEQEPYGEPMGVPQIETVPMTLRKETFATTLPSTRRRSTLREMVTDEIQAARVNVQVIIDNTLKTPVKVFVPRDLQAPKIENSQEFTAPAETAFPINSGFAKDGKTMVIIRIGLDEAMIFSMGHSAKLRVEPAPHGLAVSSNDDVDPTPYPEPRSVPNHETVPMILRKETFVMEQNRRPSQVGDSSSPLINGSSSK